MDLAKAIGADCIKFIGVRPGEKLHEEMISKEESLYAYDFDDNYTLISNPNLRNYTKYQDKENKKTIHIQSKDNDFLNINQLKKLVLNFKKYSGIK